jgi:diacylglycerol O-acyltransferase
MTATIHERMSSVDAAWLRMDSADNAMMIVGVMATAKPLRWARFRRLMETRFLKHPRFRRRPVADSLGAAWVEDPAFDLDAHVKRIALPAPAGKSELETLVADLASARLDPDRPLWQVHLVERYLGGSACIVRVHHCYADGVTMVNVLMSLTEHEPFTHPGTTHRHGTAPPAGDILDRLLAEGAKLLAGGLQQLLHPDKAAGYARQASSMLGELARVLALPDDNATPLRGALGGRKRIAWAEPIALHEVKTVGRALDCTVNDVLMATVAGALGSYLRHLAFDAGDLTVRSAVPVNLRGQEAAPTLGNKFGLVFVDLPVGIRNPLRRAYKVRETMQSVKGSMQPPMTLMLLGLLGLLPSTVQTTAIDALSRKGSLVTSNVPGPPVPLHLCGQRISELYFWVPQSGTMGVGISILSYAGQVFFGVVTDDKLVADPHAIVDRIGPEFERLLLAVTVGALAARERKPTPQRSAGKPGKRQG